MTAMLVAIPSGVGGGTWLAHVVRVAMAAAAAPPNPPSLRLERDEVPATLMQAAASEDARRVAKG